MIGMGLTGSEGLRTAVYLHGMAGEAAGREGSPDGVIASDILACLPRTIGRYRESYGQYESGLFGEIERA